MISKSILDWLLDGDPSIRWQTLRDLAGANSKTVESERRKVVRSGYAARLLSLQDPNGRWAGGLYTPKWKSTTYTMLLLRDLGVPGNDPKIRQACKQLLDNGLYRDGGINYSFSINRSETCVTGMVLSILSRFQYPDDRVRLLAGHLLKEQMPDGGWNCQRHRGATHASFHTTINVLEGLLQYERLHADADGRIARAQVGAREFLRAHRHSGKTFFELEQAGKPSRWNTLRALRVLRWFENA